MKCRIKVLAKGMTLVEVLAVVTIMLLLLIPVFKILLLNNNIVDTNMKRLEAKDSAVMVQQYIREQTKLAQEVEIRSTTSSVVGTDYENIYMAAEGLKHENKILPDGTRGDQIVFPKELFGKSTLEIKFQKMDKDIFKIIIKMSEMIGGISTQVYNEPIEVQAINMQTDSVSKEIKEEIAATPGQVIKFRIP